MSPGLGQESSKVASSTIDALKSTPVLLAILLFNIILLGSLVFMSEREGARWERVTTEMMKACKVGG